MIQKYDLLNWPFCIVLNINIHLFVLAPTWQRVLCQIHFGAVFMVDLGVYVVLLTAEARDNILLAVTAWICFRLFSVWKHSMSTQVKSCHILYYLSNCFTCEMWNVLQKCLQYPPGDVEVIEQLSLGEAFLQEAVGLFGSHLGDRTASFSRRYIWPLHQTTYTSHAAAGGEGRGWKRVPEVFVGATGQRKSLDWGCHWLQNSVGGWGAL